MFIKNSNGNYSINFTNKQFDKVNELVPINQNKKVFFISLCLFAMLSFFLKNKQKIFFA